MKSFFEKQNLIKKVIIISAIIVFIIARLCYSFLKNENIEKFERDPAIYYGVPINLESTTTIGFLQEEQKTQIISEKTSKMVIFLFLLI